MERAVLTTMVLLIGGNIAAVLIAKIIHIYTGSFSPSVLFMFCWFLLLQWFMAEQPSRRLISASRGATRTECDDFNPNRFFRIKKRMGWRNIEIVIDDAIDIPNAEIVPVQQHVRDEMAIVVSPNGPWAPVLFEYRGSLFYGHMDISR